MSRRSPVLAASVLAVASMILLGTLPPEAGAQPARPQRVRMLVPLSTAGIPLLMLADGGPIAGVQLEVDTFANHAQALALLLRGDAQLLYTGSSQGWENWIDGSPIVAIDTGCWGISSMIGADRSIHGPADLRGRRIAMPFPGSPLDVQTRWLLRRAGLNPDRDVTISYGPFTQSMPLLLAGRVDAVALPEPQATAMVRQHGLARLFVYADAWAAATGGDKRSPQITLFASAGWANEHRALIEALVPAWRAAGERLAADPRLGLPYAEKLQADPAILAEAVANTLYFVPDFPDHQRLVLAYYELVRAELPTKGRSLDASFFFRP